MVRSLILATGLSLMTPVSTNAGVWALVPDDAPFQRVESLDTFLQIINAGNLRRFGITLEVLDNGRIEGSAFGRKVTGAWEWRDGYFCRELFWGRTELGANCQEVKITGNTVRFTSDRGEGDFADLKVR
ncbi:dihydrodipicolinate reductase [Ovoidimarina sediminis]|uniref:dihydrodipicolinate reductase n=1 Tax=Ovoidimarina sediminis TaxID=3079856 RepID=UPI00291235AB|nr:dihydrodipicolinate reductase [Rhodophyticola sp. MJ-SS7]MDU8943830.1 dihydrodipicolinate reductase [Rhodophyticola sp. MJ-SS7]